MFQQDPSLLLQHGVNIFFYLVIAAFTFSSAIAMYSLIRYGKERGLVTAVGAVYLAIALTLFLIARYQLHLISFQ